MGGSCILLFLCFRDLGLYFVFEKSTKSSFYFRCFKLTRFEYKTIETADMRMQWIIWFVIFNLNLICILTNQISRFLNKAVQLAFSNIKISTLLNINENNIFLKENALISNIQSIYNMNTLIFLQK